MHGLVLEFCSNLLFAGSVGKEGEFLQPKGHLIFSLPFSLSCTFVIISVYLLLYSPLIYLCTSFNSSHLVQLKDTTTIAGQPDTEMSSGNSVWLYRG